MHGPGNTAVATSVHEWKIGPPFNLRLPGRRGGLGWLGTFTASVSLFAAVMLLWMTSYFEWKIATHAAPPDALPFGVILIAFSMPSVAIAALGDREAHV